jgi:hypothetical protein
MPHRHCITLLRPIISYTVRPKLPIYSKQSDRQAFKKIPKKGELTALIADANFKD